MKIAFGCDHAGYLHREAILDFLKKRKYKIIDVGCHSPESCDYPDYGSKVARFISEGICEKGVLVCTTGVGMCIVANKFKNSYAAVCYDDFSAEQAASHNRANILCLPGKNHDTSTLLKWIKIWLTTPFEGGRHLRRLNKIIKIEKEEFK